jgi:hypothetical protein
MATKEDEKKKLYILLGIVAVGGVVLLFMYVILPAMKKDPAPPPVEDLGELAGPVTPGPAGVTRTEEKEELDMPPVVSVAPRVYRWHEEAPRGARHWQMSMDEAMLFDPLLVKNRDVVDPGRRDYIQRIKNEWVLTGITHTWRWVTLVDEEGRPLLDEHGEPMREYRKVWEAFFAGRRRPLGENDRLPGTRFVIERIRVTPERAFVRLRGDLGDPLDLELAAPYDED